MLNACRGDVSAIHNPSASPKSRGCRAPTGGRSQTADADNIGENTNIFYSKAVETAGFRSSQSTGSPAVSTI